MDKQEAMVGFNRHYTKRISIGKTIKDISYYRPFTRIGFTDGTFLQLNLNLGLEHTDLLTATAYAELNVTGYDKWGNVIIAEDED